MRFNSYPALLAIVTLVLVMSRSSAAAQPTPIVVRGWPLSLNEAQKAILSNDAIMESLVCPSLTRLNLQTRQSEPVLLEKIEDKGSVWHFTLAAGLTFWDEQPVTLGDLEAFVRETLQVRKSELLAGKIPDPHFSSKERTLSIHWTQKPAFGPYIFNKRPIRKKSSANNEILCAGNWVPEHRPEGLWLRDRSGEGRNTILLSADPKESDGPAERQLSFVFGEEMQTSLKPLTQDLLCERPLDTPILTVIAWNPDSPVTQDARFRRALTHLTPRGALLRAGAGSMGSLVSAPILRAHPGYKRSLLVRAYDPGKADAILNDLGYRRLDDDGFRRDRLGKALEVKILVRDHSGSTLLRKVLDDSFRALGIKLNFIEDGGEIPDGILTGIMTSWPDGDLREGLHSRSSQKSWPWAWNDRNLDQALDAYALTLTQKAPDFTLLEKVHDLMYKLEPFSVLMQHRVCLKARLDRPIKAAISVRNPDWFRRLIGL